jgi:outer membrane protein TolC
MTRLRFRRGALSAILLALAAAPLAGQAPAAVERLIAETLERHPLLEAGTHAEAAARAQARASRGALLPSLELGSRASRQEGGFNLGDLLNPAYAALNEMGGAPRFPTDVDLTLPQRYDTRLRLTQPLYAPALGAARAAGGGQEGGAAAARQADAAGMERRTLARRLAAEVQGAYYRAASTRRAAEIHRATLALTAEAERVAERRLEAGSATPDLVLRARAERSEAEQRLLEAEAAARAALRALNQLAGRPLDAPLDPVRDEELMRPLPLSAAEAVAHALAGREEIGTLEARAGAADAGARAVTASYLPQVAVAVDVGVQGSDLSWDDGEYLLGSLVLTWNLYRGGADGARREAAVSEGLWLRALQNDARERVQLEALRSHETALTAHAAVASARDREAAAVRAQELVTRRFEEGAASHLELIDARRARTAAELNLSLTLYGYATALADLERAAALRTFHTETAR